MTRSEKLRKEAEARREFRDKPEQVFTVEKRHNYTYLLIYSNGMRYHGVRSCHGDIELDKYYGSSKYTPKEVPEKFILTTHSTRKAAVLEEIRYHNEHDVKNNYLYYNRANATAMGFSIGASKWTWTRKDEIRKRLKPMKKRFDVLKKNFLSRRCSCLSCKKPIYINQITEHVCSC